ncbi:BRCA1 C Terminus (BRCT) domain [Popillia japonica]|uniref:PAX-interacting protein 1 n=1 Tax=Popillia japonica TaxID=7064 RepID=A0AAW1N2J0_POPJA
MQSQFNQQQAQQQQIINQQTVVVSQNQQNVLQQQFGSPNTQQFQQQQPFVQQFGSPNTQQFQQQQPFVQQQPQFNQPQPTQQLIQTQQGQQQVIACQQQQVQVQPQQQQQLLAQQQMKPQQIIGQQQLVNQKLNIQQIAGQQHILLQQQQPQQVQGTQESPQRATNQHIWQQQPPTPSPTPTPQPQQAQINIQRHPNVPGQGPRVQWAPNQQPGVVLPQRQYIHLDEQTHQQLQQMSPEDRALFVQKLHKHRQQVLQNRMQAQQQQRAGHILIRGGVPIGLNSQQQMQWLQQQAKQQGVVLQQQTVSQGAIVQQPNPNLQHATPGLSPIQQQPQFTDQNQQLQLQRQQQQQQLRLQQLQLHQQREQAQKTVLQQQPQGQPPLAQPAQPTVVRALVQNQVVEGAQQQPQGQPPLAQPAQPTVVRALVQNQVVEGAGAPPVVVDPNVVQAPQSPLVVNSKTKTALANMLNTRLQSGGSTLSENIAEPSAAGTLKLMTAQHNAALNTGNRPHDLLFFQQRRIINRPTTEVIRPPPAQSVPPGPQIDPPKLHIHRGIAQSVPPGPQIDPPKLQYSPRNSVPLQHRPGTYYGHNPNLKLPPDLFLLGCVFVVVELERFLDESMPGWQKKIEKHGGEIEKQYCNRVTHVICETQRHGVVMQALRDFKRCVTLYWLSDVINRKQVLPPWIALHLPTMYWDTAPASKHLVCLTGFLATERDRVKHMIKYIGAGLTTYFSKHNTLLITTKAEGPKYNHAKKWGTPVVNVQWLTDIMLGHFTALNQLEHVKYQHFTDPPNFSFDPLLVPNLMHAWKMPINISQESYEKVKRSASPVVVPPNSKPKKIKLEQTTVTDVVVPPNSKPKKIKLEQTTVTDENDNEDLVLQSTASYRIMLSMCVEVDELRKFIRQLGGVLTKSSSDCTHLIMPQLKRTHKLLCSICVGSYILPESWLRDSHAAGKFLDESNYTIDTKEFNSEFKCDFNQTLSTKNRNKLFEGKHFFITPSIVPRKKELIELIEFCGGNVERNRRTLAQIEATNISSPYSYIILTHENDLHLVADLLKNKKDKVRIVCNSELVLSAILKQTFEVEPYAVKFL